MRVYTIALFLLCFSLVFSVIDGMGIFPEEATAGMRMDDNTLGVQAEELSEKMINDSSNVKPGITGILGIGELVMGAVGVVIKMFELFIVGFANLLIACKVPVAIAAMFQIIIWFIMAFGIFQLISGRQMKGME